jgi:hypothetical protein
MTAVTRMTYDLLDADLATVLAQGRLVAEEAQRAFGRLSAEPLNWKPREGEWSVAQCFEHLIVSNRPYLTIIEEIRQGRRRPRAWERVPVLPRVFGRLLIRTLHPETGRKVKARPAFHPSRSQIAVGIVAAFLEQQGRLLHLMETTRGLDVERIVITSPVVRLVTYSLMDAYRIVVVHEQNHLAQARRVMASPGFPSA